MHPDKESGLDLFCCHASDRLTDHLPHGEGLLCFEWLRSLGENGAGVYAYSPHPALAGEYPWLDLYVSQARIRFPSFAHHVYNREAQEIYRRLAPRLHAPWVWRQYPYVEAFPAFDTFGAPLAIGPLYSWFVERPLRGENAGSGCGRIISPRIPAGAAGCAILRGRGCSSPRAARSSAS